MTEAELRYGFHIAIWIAVAFFGPCGAAAWEFAAHQHPDQERYWKIWSLGSIVATWVATVMLVVST